MHKGGEKVKGQGDQNIKFRKWEDGILGLTKMMKHLPHHNQCLSSPPAPPGDDIMGKDFISFISHMPKSSDMI